jgi:hypothetical protein
LRIQKDRCHAEEFHGIHAHTLPPLEASEDFATGTILTVEVNKEKEEETEYDSCF